MEAAGVGGGAGAAQRVSRDDVLPVIPKKATAFGIRSQRRISGGKKNEKNT
jgi:hypothetical protein